MTGSLRGLSRCPDTYLALAISGWHWVRVHALHHAARLTAAHWLRPGVLCSWRRYSRLYTAGTHVHCTLYNCTHPVIVFKIYWRLEDLRGEERTWEGRWKLKDIRFKINAMLEGLYKHIMMMLSETRWTQAWPGGRGTQWTLTCVTCHYHWFVICLYLTTSRTLNHCAHFKVNGIIGVYTRRHLL